MKKLSVIVAMALAAAVNYSCGEYDNAAGNGKTVFVDENGVEHETDLVATFYGNPGETATIGISGYADDFYVVKSGDYETPATEVKANDDKANTTAAKRTNFELTVGDDGIVKLYGNSNIKTLYLIGVTPTAWDQEKLAEVEYVQIRESKVDFLKFTALEKLNYLYIYKCDGVNNLDVSELANLGTLRITNTTNPQLSDIDLSKNTELTYVQIAGSPNEKGKLTYIDLSNNTKLTDILLANNQLQTVKLASSYPDLKTISISGNQLTELNLNGNFPSLTSITANGNQLTAIDVASLSAITNLNVSSNKLTFATLPAINAVTKIKNNFTSQADIEVKSPVSVLDLTDQAYVNGTETKFEFNNGLTEGEDYVVVEAGKFQFVKALNGVVVSMTNTVFDGLTLKTTAFSTSEPSNTVFSWESKDLVEGGTVTAVPSTYDVPPFIEKIGLWRHQYATIVIDGTEESVSKEKYNYMRIDLDEPLKEGMKLQFTGFRDSEKEDANASLYFVFALPNYWEWAKESKEDYLPYQFDYATQPTTYSWPSTFVFNNIFNNSLTPNTEVLVVDKALAGVKSFKVVRNNDAQTEIYLTKILVTRK